MDGQPPMPPRPLLVVPDTSRAMDESLPPPPPGKKTLGGRLRELVYPLSIALTSFVISFILGVGAAVAFASSMASRLLALLDDAVAYGWQLFDVYQRLGLLAAAGTFANAVATIADNRLDEIAAKYKPASLDAVIKALLVGGRENVPAYQQYPFLGMILVPAMTAILFFFMVGIRLVRNLSGFGTLVEAASQIKK